jgi:hypothetical protein
MTGLLPSCSVLQLDGRCAGTRELRERGRFGVLGLVSTGKRSWAVATG